MLCSCLTPRHTRTSKKGFDLFSASRTSSYSYPQNGDQHQRRDTDAHRALMLDDPGQCMPPGKAYSPAVQRAARIPAPQQPRGYTTRSPTYGPDGRLLRITPQATLEQQLIPGNYIESSSPHVGSGSHQEQRADTR